MSFEFDIDIKNIKTPVYLVDERKLIKNLEKLQYVKKASGAKILLAQKAFSMYYFYPLIGQYLDGTTASSYNEARLGKEEMGGETHIFNPAFSDDEFDEIMELCDTIVFNSINQWEKFKDRVRRYDKPISCGIRVNPEYSDVETDIYNPAGRYSRLGVTIDNFDISKLKGDDISIEGLHFHCLCEQNVDALENTLEAFESKFGPYIEGMKWLNFGGGHHITRDDYNVDRLVELIIHYKEKYNTEIYLEPGEAVALNAGYLITTVADIMHNEMDIAILDTSCTCHMPDVLEMPYRPPLLNSGLPNEKAYTYRLGGPTCLAGDIIGDFSFDERLKVGDKLVFGDMAHYTMVKNTTFNGINLPDIAVYDERDGIKVVKSFGYEDFKSRL